MQGYSFEIITGPMSCGKTEELLRRIRRCIIAKKKIKVFSPEIFKILKEEGFSIPDDIQVSGFDNIDLCHMVTPSITTVSQDRKAIGKKAYELLAKRIAGKEVNKNNIINFYI